MAEKGYSLTESDLAEERHAASFRSGGVLFSRRSREGIGISDLRIVTQEGAEAIGRGIGRYITVSFPAPSLLTAKLSRAVAQEIAQALRTLLPERRARLLIVGLGNRHLTADALGVRTAEGIECLSEEGRALSVLIPGTAGETGMESASLIRAAVSVARPDAVILIDALAAADPARLLAAAELCDTGLSPGTGVRGSGVAVDAALLGVPTVAIGVPTVMRIGALLRHLSADAERPPEGLWVVPSALDAGIKLIAALLGEAIHTVFEEGYKV